MKVLMLANEFPSFHPMRGKPTGFAEKFLRGEKIHTCRLNAEVFWKTGDIVSVRRWTGKAYQSVQTVIAEPVALRVVPVTIEFTRNGWLFVTLDGLKLDSREFAKNDGLSFIDFLNWFFPRRKKDMFDKWVGSCVFFGRM